MAGDLESQQRLNELYFRNYSHLLDLASEDRRLLAPDAENVTRGVARHLPDYTGELSDQAFQAWAAAIIKPAAERLEFFYALRKQYRRSVLAGVWSVLKNNKDLSDHDDPGRTACAIADDVWLWVFQNIEVLLVPGTATLGTRLQAKAKFAALTWRKSRLRERDKHVGIDAAQVGAQDFCTIEGTDADAAGIDIGDRTLYVEPDYEELEDDDNPRGAIHQKVRIGDGGPGGQSGTPRVLCPKCQTLQPVSPDSVHGSEMTLMCGHSRPAAMQVTA